MTPSQSSIVAVIVTHNRLADLKRCIKAVRGQTLAVDAIIVVDNDSTDATSGWLASQPDLIAVHCPNNGGAAGFAAGLRYAKRQGYHAMWLLDDDLLPFSDSLHELVAAASADRSGSVVFGSVVVDPNDPDRLSCRIPVISTYSRLLDHYLRRTDRRSELVAGCDSLGYPWGMFFNSVLLPGQALDIAGFPRDDMFIWGDEVEYFLRLRSRGFRTYLIPESVATHPRTIDAPPRWKEKYGARNAVYLDRTYYRRFWLRFAARVVRAVRSGKLYLLPPLMSGLAGDLHTRYLP